MTGPGLTTKSPFGHSVRVVAGVPTSANFESGWNGYDFFTLKDRELVTVAR
jgi:hypothetical protein